MNDYSKTIVFRLNDHGQGPELLRQVFLERGWVEFDEDGQEEHDWNMWWRTSRFRSCDHDQLNPWQRLNHYPKSTAITKKDSLARNLKRMKSVHGAVYNFSPIAFNLPNDYTRFVSEYSQSKEKGLLYWICKPADMSRGRGIFIFKDLGELQYDFSAVVQQYIPDPLLISGYKFDLRIYVMVSSFHPLNIHIYNEGLVRFSTEKYDLSTLKNVYAHLTNTSINKNSPSYATDKERIGPGCKWTLTQLRYYIHHIGVDDTVLFGKIINIIILTLLVQAQQVPKVFNCFELYGFDILIDSNMKPWLLEVNFSPALSYDCQTDITVKKPLLHDLCDLLRFNDKDKERGGEEYRIQRDQANHLKSNMYPSFIPPVGGGRRSSLGNISGRKPPPLTKRGSSNKLPAVKNQGNNHPLNSTPRSSINPLTFSDEQDEPNEVVAHKPPPTPEHRVLKLVPGCGLPSVQQPHNMVDHLASDSGNTSLEESDNEEETDNNNNNRKAGNHVNQDSSTMSNAHQKKKSSNASLYASHFKAHRPLYGNNINKRTMKVSATSDSGVSSYSGSSNSDASHTPPKNEVNPQTSIQNMSYSHKSNQETLQNRLNHIDYHEGVHHTKEDSKSKQGNLSHIRGVANVTSQLDSNYPQTNTLENTGSSADNQVRPLPKYGTNRKGERLTRISRDFRNPRKYQIPLNLPSQAHVRGRIPAIRPQSQLSNHQAQSNYQTITPRTTRDRNSNYSRPWRKTKSIEGLDKPSSPKISPYNPEQVVGGFHLVFPFNDITKRCAQSSLDPKTVIKECQKLLKERVTKAQERSKQKSVKTASKENSTVQENAQSARSHRSLGVLSQSGNEKMTVTSSKTRSRPTSSSLNRGDAVSAKSNVRSSVPSSRTNSRTHLSGSNVASTRSSPALNPVHSGGKSESVAAKSTPTFSDNHFVQEPQELWGPLKQVSEEEKP